MTIASRPQANEYAPYYEKYVRLVQSDDIVRTLRVQGEQTQALLRGVSPEDSLRRYADGKWSLRELVGHVADTERVFAYRALRFARGDQAPLAGFEQEPWVAAQHSDRRAWPELLADLDAVRRATVSLFGSFDADAWQRCGIASNNEVSVRALAWIIAGHELHHVGIARERYLTQALPA
jgi:hypothetical protein